MSHTRRSLSTRQWVRFYTCCNCHVQWGRYLSLSRRRAKVTCAKCNCEPVWVDVMMTRKEAKKAVNGK